MKSIKIQPLTLIDDLKIKTNVRKSFKLEDPIKQEQFVREMMALLNQGKSSGIIIGKQLKGQPVAVATNFKTSDGHIFQFPEPNPVHIYFQNACNHLKTSQVLLKELKSIDSFRYEKQYEKFILYFSEVTIGIVFLVTTLEAFINQQIPDDIAYPVDEKQKWNKQEIEKKSIKTKVKLIIPFVYEVHFQKTNEKHYSLILEVQDIRDELIHLKTAQTKNKTIYETIMKRLLDFEPRKYIEATFLYLNSLKGDYIQEELP